MKLLKNMTLLTANVILLVSTGFNTAFAAQTVLKKQNKQVNDYQWSSQFAIARSTSLYDHKDGTRSDGMDYFASTSLKSPIGSFSAKAGYSQNLNDNSPEASDFSDISTSYSLNSFKWNLADSFLIKLTPFMTALIPLAKTTVKRDQLQTAISVGNSFRFEPETNSANQLSSWSLGLSLSVGQNFHNYSTDVNGRVLNQYSSNQSINGSYSYENLSFSLEFTNKLRWSYEGTQKNYFEHTEEVGYAFLDNRFSVSLGHTNSGSVYKANNSDSNIELINENDSTVYLSIGLGL